MEILWRCEDFEQQKSRAQGPAKEKEEKRIRCLASSPSLSRFSPNAAVTKVKPFSSNLKPIRRDAGILP
jgi:hypothetical protein